MWRYVSRLGESRALRAPFTNPVSRRIAWPFVALLYASIAASFDDIRFDLEERALLVDADSSTDAFDAGVGVGLVKTLPSVLGLGGLLYVEVLLPHAAAGVGVEAAATVVVALFAGAVAFAGFDTDYRVVKDGEGAV